jgi:hypothetical protein
MHSQSPFQLVNTYQNDKLLHAMTQKSRKEIDSCSDPFGNVRLPISLILVLLKYRIAQFVSCCSLFAFAERFFLVWLQLSQVCFHLASSLFLFSFCIFGWHHPPPFRIHTAKRPLQAC